MFFSTNLDEGNPKNMKLEQKKFGDWIKDFSN